MLYYPALVALAGLVVWLGLWFVAPLNYLFELRGNTIGFIVAAYVSFFIGCFWAQSSQDKDRLAALDRAEPWNGELSTQIYWASTATGLFGMALRFYDRIVVRGVDYAAEASELRDALQTTDFSGASAVASVFMPFCFMPLMLLLGSRFERGHWFKYLIAIPVFCLPMIESLAQLSRSIMLLTLALGFFSVCLFRFKGQIMRRELLLPLVGGTAGLLFVSALMFDSRLQSYGRTLEDSLYESVYANAFAPNRKAIGGFRSGDAIERQYYAATLPNQMYYLSGVYEFDLSFNRPDGQKFAYGTYIFYPYSRIFATIFGEENIRGLNEEEIIYRTGVFTSFIGPLWVDFGYFTFVFLLLVGFGLQSVSPYVRAGYVNIVPFYIFAMVAVFLAPVFNFLISGFGFFILHGFLLFALFSSFGLESDRSEGVSEPFAPNPGK